MIVLLIALAGCNTDVGITQSSACDGILQPGEVTVDAPFDCDGDGYFDGANAGCQDAYDAASLDCDDAQADVNPGAAEVECDGIDQDCDEQGTPDGAGTAQCVTDFSGNWMTAAPVVYQCAHSVLLGGYLVDINFFNLSVDDNGDALPFTMASTGAQPGNMTGTRSSDGAFNVSHALTGMCNETYNIVGNFTDATTMEATLTASFTGNGCSDCTGQSIPFTATKN